jgi:hypothetical protein
MKNWMSGNCDACKMPYEAHPLCRICERLVHGTDFCADCTAPIPPHIRVQIVQLLTIGSSYQQIIDYFGREGFEIVEVYGLFHECGVTLPHRLTDYSGISDDRRHELQALSMTE